MAQPDYDIRQIMDVTQPATPHIPDELFVTIFHNLLARRCALSRQAHDEIVRDCLLPLSLACKRFRNIATELYYTSNTFLIQRGEYAGIFNYGRVEKFRYPPFKFGHYVRHLALQLQYSNHCAGGIDYFFSVESDMSRLWRSKRAIQVRGEHWKEYRGMEMVTQHRWSHSTNTYWQRHFPSLISVNVRVELDGYARPDDLERVRDLSRLASVPLRSRRVQIETVFETGWRVRVESTPCTRALEKTLKEMMCLETPLKNDKT